VAHGTLLVKFWLHISPDEQEKRFRARAEEPHKQWKLTDDDWRNREKWPAYEAAVHDMVERTSTRVAPWHLIGANDKERARLEVLDIVGDVLEAALAGGERGKKER
jgi:polyphosphate kinase 2 (PPK2 family)